MTADASGNVYVSYLHDNTTERDPAKPLGPPALAEYARGSYTKPKRVISGVHANVGTAALTVDPNGNTYVLAVQPVGGAGSGVAGGTVSEFAPAADGDAAPTKTFAVTLSGGVGDPFAIAADGKETSPCRIPIRRRR